MPFYLINTFCKTHYFIRKRIYRITLQNNGTFRVFYAKLYILLSVGGSTNCRNEIILVDIIIIKYGSQLQYEISYTIFSHHRWANLTQTELREVYTEYVIIYALPSNVLLSPVTSGYGRISNIWVDLRALNYNAVTKLINHLSNITR